MNDQTEPRQSIRTTITDISEGGYPPSAKTLSAVEHVLVTHNAKSLGEWFEMSIGATLRPAGGWPAVLISVRGNGRPGDPPIWAAASEGGPVVPLNEEARRVSLPQPDNAILQARIAELSANEDFPYVLESTIAFSRT